MILKDKVAVITGASRGIGREIALKFAECGAKTVLVARNLDLLKQLKDEMIQKKYIEPLLFSINVSQEEDFRKMAEAVLDKWSQIDILVNNAGITRDALLLRMSESDWDEVIDTNLKGTFVAMKVVAKIMLGQRRGRIINMASVVALVGNPGQSNYAASKAGIIALTKSVAREFASRNILVNAIAPGFIDTEMTQVLPEAVRNVALSGIPLKRFGKAGDVADVALFLASESSSYITGQVITVDGGMVM